jgi:hypothetical protein
VVRKYILACSALAAFASIPAKADMPMLPPNYTTGMMAPVIMDQCTGGRCSGNNAPRQRQRQQQGSSENSRATCANARNMTPAPEQKATHARLLSLCASIGL